MADTTATPAGDSSRGGIHAGFGDRGSGRGRSRGRGRGRGRVRGAKDGDKEWVHVTKLTSRQRRQNQVFGGDLPLLLPIKECNVISSLSPATLKDEVHKILPDQKQTRADQRTRFKAFVAVGDYIKYGFQKF